MIACCGLDCDKCGAFIATQKNDDSMRAKVAKEWRELYNVPVEPEHINCTGCKSDGVKTVYCEQMCEVRKCCLNKKLENCAPCESFPCDKLNEIFNYSQEAKNNLIASKNK